MKDIPDKISRNDPNLLEKRSTLSQVLPLISNNDQIIISGSLSQILSESTKSGIISFDEIDLSNIHDIDLATTSTMDFYTKGRLEKELETGGNSFPIEVNYLVDAYSCQSGPKEEGIRVFTITNNGVEYPVRVMTPAYLLVTLVEQEVGEPTSPDKFRRKILEIQAMDSFSQNDFLAIARYNIRERYEMNKDTFERWKRMSLEAGDGTNGILTMKSESESNYGSIIDLALFMNLIDKVSSVSQIDYGSVRKVTKLEKFTRDLMMGEG